MTANVSNYTEQGGARTVIGGEIDIVSGGALKIAGTDKTAVLAAAVAAPTAGVAAGYKVARGEVTLDGTNPTPIVTGLATVVACAVTDKRATAPGLDPTHFTVDYGGGVTAGTVNLYAWKPTGSGDATLIASTDNDDVVSWIAIGT
jgi:hypothetical protein